VVSCDHRRDHLDLPHVASYLFCVSQSHRAISVVDHEKAEDREPRGVILDPLAKTARLKSPPLARRFELL
jgi:hypothetical protein